MHLKIIFICVFFFPEIVAKKAIGDGYKRNVLVVGKLSNCLNGQTERKW